MAVWQDYGVSQRHMPDFTLLQLRDAWNHLSPAPAKSCLAEWEQGGKVADSSCCLCAFTRVSKETPYSTSCLFMWPALWLHKNFPLSLPKLQTCWGSSAVRNIVSLNFFPNFQFQRGNLFSKLGELFAVQDSVKKGSSCICIRAEYYL